MNVMVTSQTYETVIEGAIFCFQILFYSKCVYISYLLLVFIVTFAVWLWSCGLWTHKHLHIHTDFQSDMDINH